MAVKLSEEKRARIGYVILDTMGDVFYEPWEWGDMESLPPGHEAWTEEAVEAWQRRLAIRAADAAIATLEKAMGTKEWVPRRKS